MRFRLKKASDLRYEDEVEINSLDELVLFIDKNGEIIMDTEQILIYDNYVE